MGGGGGTHSRGGGGGSRAYEVIGRCCLELLDIKTLGNFRLGLVNGAVALVRVVMYSRVRHMRVGMPVPHGFQARGRGEMSS